MPCEGIFADVKKLDPENVTKENPEIFFERYKHYKRFFEPRDGKSLVMTRKCIV